jgi:hypothetical protein
LEHAYKNCLAIFAICAIAHLNLRCHTSPPPERASSTISKALCSGAVVRIACSHRSIIMASRNDFSSLTDTYDNQHETLDEDSDLLYGGLLTSSAQDISGRSKETLALFKAYQHLLATK